MATIAEIEVSQRVPTVPTGRRSVRQQRRRPSPQRLAAIAVVTVTACGSATDSDAGDTLAPLPVPDLVSTTEPEVTVAVATTGATTTPDTVATTLLDQPVGDWDGARFDIGAIERVGDLDSFRTIDYDRFSYQHPTIGLVDAAGFTEEPVPYWWVDDPLQNNQSTEREFVLTPDVELLALAESGEEQACAEPRPAILPSPVWEGVDISFLDTRAARDAVAVLTYNANGAVSRIRFTSGCE